MEFTLTYRGSLHPKGSKAANKEHVHSIRSHFHHQIKNLWEQEPLIDYQELLKKDDGIRIKRYGIDYVPLVCKKLSFVCHLDITLLRPQVSGEIVHHSGDIDNRLKTLFDSLSMPQNKNQLPKDAREHKSIFYSLLEDDALITKVSVESDRFLEAVEDESEVLLIIRVNTKCIKSIYWTQGLC